MSVIFIVVEGMDGSGKTSLVKKLGSALEARYSARVQQYAQPGGTLIGSGVRSLLSEHPGIPPLSKAFLLNAARSEMMYMILAFRNLYKNSPRHTFVISDRHSVSTRVYQGIEGVPRETLMGMEALLPPVVPSATLYLDLPPKEAKKRTSARKKDSTDFYDNQPLEFYQEVRKRYLEEARVDPCPHWVLDASKSPDEVLREALEWIELHEEELGLA